jgi:hypothetical protein
MVKTKLEEDKKKRIGDKSKVKDIGFAPFVKSGSLLLSETRQQILSLGVDEDKDEDVDTDQFTDYSSRTKVYRFGGLLATGGGSGPSGDRGASTWDFIDDGEDDEEEGDVGEDEEEDEDGDDDVVAKPQGKASKKQVPEKGVKTGRKLIASKIKDEDEEDEVVVLDPADFK